MSINNLIKFKYDNSNEIYDKKLNHEDPEIYLYYFDIMNVYPLFPSLLSFDLKKYISPIDIISSITFNKISSNDNKNNELIDEMYKKIDYISNIPYHELKKRARPAIRKLFSYEIIDKITDQYNGEYVTVAWMKCYEILEYYNLLDHVENDTVMYFGICEQPGAFVYAINHYVKTKLNKKFDFVIESLIDPSNKKIFLAEKSLSSKYKDKYDYGEDGTGDVTKINNIKYYRQKYIKEKKIKFNLLTADCGLDSSDDFSQQEEYLTKVFFGQLLLALSLCSKGTNYFFKLFTAYEHITQHMIYLAGLFFDEIYFCRTLTTKPESGENYLVMKNFNKNVDDMDTILDKLYEWYDSDNNILFNLTNIPQSYTNAIKEINLTLTYRRITSVNFLIFRFNNGHYAAKYKNFIHEYIKKIVNHYMDYFIDYYKIKKLENNDKLVNK